MESTEHNKRGILTARDTLLLYNYAEVVSHREDKPEPFITDAGPLETELEKKKAIQEILTRIFPPREWEEGGVLWRQTVSCDPATYMDTKRLNERLQTSLKQQNATETGVCPIRRRLFNQFFDELIRQEAVHCGERGLILMRIRDEMKMVLEKLQRLYESGISFGVRKMLLAKQGYSDMEESAVNLKKERERLENELEELMSTMKEDESMAAEQRETEKNKHAEVVKLLKHKIAQQKEELEARIYPKKKIIIN